MQRRYRSSNPHVHLSYSPLVIAPPLVIPPPAPLPNVADSGAGSTQPPSVRYSAAVEQRNEQNAQVGQQLGSAIAGLIDLAIQRHKAANQKKPIPLPGPQSDGHFSWGTLGDCYLDPVATKAFCTKDGKITYDQRRETEQQTEANVQALLRAPDSQTYEEHKLSGLATGSAALIQACFADMRSQAPAQISAVDGGNLSAFLWPLSGYSVRHPDATCREYGRVLRNK